MAVSSVVSEECDILVEQMHAMVSAGIMTSLFAGGVNTRTHCRLQEDVAALARFTKSLWYG